VRGREKISTRSSRKRQDEAAIAADYMKSGSAVVLKPPRVDQMNAVRYRFHEHLLRP